MSNIRKTVISNCEKQFLIKNLTNSVRLDGRSLDEFRKIEIQFGKEWGCCSVSLGKTRVLAQVSSEIQEPKSSRPSEGILNINVELNPLAAPHFESGRQSDLSVQLNRLLEKCLKDSKAVDLESLCIKMNEKVWALKVDINVLNHEGNILDCASIAALCALTHFKRPDVTSDGEEFIIHTYHQRDPIPTVIHHYPLCITYSVFNGGDIIVADPNLLEEGVADGFLSVGLNSYKELCGLHLGGKVDLGTDVILSTTNKAANRVYSAVQLIKDAVAQDNLERQEKRELGFHKTVESVAEQSADIMDICMDQFLWKSKTHKKNSRKNVKNENIVKSESHVDKVESLGKGSAVLVSETKHEISKGWTKSESESDDLDEDVIMQPVEIEVVNVDSGSEEDQVVILEPNKKSKKKTKVKT